MRTTALLLAILLCASFAGAALDESFSVMVDGFDAGEGVTIVYGANENYQDFYAAAIIAGIVSGELQEPFSRFPTLVSDAQVDLEAVQNLILIGGPCSNAMVGRLFADLRCDGWQLEEGEALIAESSDDSHRAILIAGSHDADTLSAAHFMRQYNSSVRFENPRIVYSNSLTIAQGLNLILHEYVINDELIIVPSTKGASTDFPAALELAGFIFKNAPRRDARFFPDIRTPEQISDLAEKNLIVIGGPCVNPYAEDLIDEVGYNCKDWRLSSNESIIKLVRDEDRLILLLAGTGTDPAQTLNLIDLINSYTEHAILDRADEVIVHDNGSISILEHAIAPVPHSGWLSNLLGLLGEGEREYASLLESDVSLFEYVRQEKVNKNCYSCFMERLQRDYVFKIIDRLSEQHGLAAFQEGEKRYILGKTTDNAQLLCSAMDRYEEALSELDDEEDRLFVLENLLFLAPECVSEREQFRYLAEVLDLCERLGYDGKYAVYSRLFETGDLGIYVEPVEVDRTLQVPRHPERMILGRSFIRVDSSDRLAIQVERTTRDWLSLNISNFPNHAPDFSRGKGVPYMEGDILNRIFERASPEVFTVTNTLIVARRGPLTTTWYAQDEQGVFRFEVLPDKVQYPTTKCLKNVCLFVDTHGISALVSKSLKGNASLVVGCGDHYAKMQAASYLVNRGVDVLFPCDRFVSQMLAHRGPGTAIGTAPVTSRDGYSIIGNQSVVIDLDEPIVIQTTTLPYPAQYYDAPKRYFDELQKRYGIDLETIVVKTNQERLTGNVVERARQEDVHVIAARVAYQEDYLPVRAWLAESTHNRAILFHTAPYAWGYRLFEEFPAQTSFGDPHPVFE